MKEYYFQNHEHFVIKIVWLDKETTSMNYYEVDSFTGFGAWGREQGFRTYQNWVEYIREPNNNVMFKITKEQADAYILYRLMPVLSIGKKYAKGPVSS